MQMKDKQKERVMDDKKGGWKGFIKDTYTTTLIKKP